MPVGLTTAFLALGVIFLGAGTEVAAISAGVIGVLNQIVVEVAAARSTDGVG